MQQLKFVLLLHSRVHFLDHGHARRCGEESNAGRRSAAEEVQGNRALHHPQLQDGGSAGERSLPRPERDAGFLLCFCCEPESRLPLLEHYMCETAKLY